MRDGSLKIVVGTGFVMGFCFVLALNETRLERNSPVLEAQSALHQELDGVRTMGLIFKLLMAVVWGSFFFVVFLSMFSF